MNGIISKTKPSKLNQAKISVIELLPFRCGFQQHTISLLNVCGELLWFLSLSSPPIRNASLACLFLALPSARVPNKDLLHVFSLLDPKQRLLCYTFLNIRNCTHAMDTCTNSSQYNIYRLKKIKKEPTSVNDNISIVDFVSFFVIVGKRSGNV